jgi:cellulose synthase/poly-beta-1,6-N-acetylglucosamine synthase-like glycosyltransferase
VWAGGSACPSVPAPCRFRPANAFIAPARSAGGASPLDIAEIILAVFALLLALGSLGGSLYLIVMAARFKEAVDAALGSARPSFAPPATLFVPTRGDPAALEVNLRALLAQAYPDLQVVMVVDRRDEPLFALGERLCAEVAPGRARCVATEDFPVAAHASGKCAAHLRALREARSESEVFVFADDDIRPDPGWFGRLVAHLGEEKVSVATAYRWYFAAGGGLASHVRSAWNFVGLQIMFNDRWNFAWGGGMAIRRGDFDRWEIAKGWERAISDDYVVTINAKRDKRPIRFVPSTLAPSYETVSFGQLLEWCRRQTFMTKIYDPGLWKYAVVPYLFFNGLLVLGAALLVAAGLGLALPWWALAAAVAFVLHVPLNMVKASILYGAVLPMVPDKAEELRRSRAPFLVGAALAPFITLYALARTRNMRHIEWRGRSYEVNGPLDVRPL